MLIEVICEYCEGIFKKKDSEIKRTKNNFCSYLCHNLWMKEQNMRFCLHCEKPTNNKKFCSRSCSVSFNNLLNSKRHKKNTCTTCGIKISRKNKYCTEHSPKIDWGQVTLGYIKSLGLRRSYTRINSHARREYNNSNKPKSCLLCGYAKHFQVCHKKSISTFKDSTPVSIINSIDNLIALCPNHHWEYDHNLLDVVEVVELVDTLGCGPSVLNKTCGIIPRPSPHISKEETIC